MSDNGCKDPASAQTRNPILWGAYLACSWTWCIGMFLPAVLLRDMGWAGFLIFAIPNVIGAAAMGWFIKTRIDSVRFVESHPVAVWWFSAITLAFHVFWMLWILNFIRDVFQIPDPYLVGVAGIGAAFFLILGKAIRFGRAPQLALALLTLSLGVLIATFVMPDVKEANAALLDSAPGSTAPLWMFPVMIFGFLLCPYLDLTFHHARQQLDTQKNGRLGFTIGFVVFFTCMIILTTRYAGVIAGTLSGVRFVSIASPWLAAGILTHILCQWIFTVRVHFDRICTLSGSPSKRPILFILALLSGLIGFFAIKLPAYAGLTGGEIIYRSFMSAYGLVFPSYMLYLVVIARRGKSALSLPMMWIAIALASPMFWLGFIERQTIWLVPGMGVVMLGAMVLFIKRPQSPDASSSEGSD